MATRSSLYDAMIHPLIAALMMLPPAILDCSANLGMSKSGSFGAPAGMALAKASCVLLEKALKFDYSTKSTKERFIDVFLGSLLLR